MAGFGFSYGFRVGDSHRSSGPLLGKHPPVLSPHPAWTGAAGSGFSVLPTDQLRQTAKPAMRLMVPPNQRFTDDLLVGVLAFANVNGTLNSGVQDVIFQFEGNIATVRSMSFETFDDANGIPVTYLGYWVRLKKPEGTEGDSQLYVKATPSDATMQNRVIGPFEFSMRDTEHDASVTVNSVGDADYTTVTAAIEALRELGADNPLITITGGGPYVLPVPDQTYMVKNYITVEASTPVAFSNPNTFDRDDDNAIFRPRVSAIRFRGSNIIFDFLNAIIYRPETGGRTWFDGVFITNSHSDGAARLYEGSPMQSSSLMGGNQYMTECNVSEVIRSAATSRLVRGGTFTHCADDLFTSSQMVIGTTTSQMFSDEFRAVIDALTMQYTGSATTATIEMPEGVTATRTAVLKEDGQPVATFEILPASNAVTRVSDFVAFVNGVTDWSATLLDDTRAANWLGAQDFSESGIDTPLDAKTAPLTLATSIPLHTDWYQLTNSSDNDENVILAFNKMFDSSGQSVFIAGFNTNPSDFFVVGNAFDNRPTDENFSQWARADFSHVVMAHNSWSTQGVILRTDLDLTTDAYCMIASNTMESLQWTGTSDTDLVITNNHLQANANIPNDATDTTKGGDNESLFADALIGDFTPAGDLLTNLKPPVFEFGFNRETRVSPSEAGAVTGQDGIPATPPAPPVPTETPPPISTPSVPVELTAFTAFSATRSSYNWFNSDAMTLDGSNGIALVPNHDGSGDYHLSQSSSGGRPVYGANGPEFVDSDNDRLELHYPGGAGPSNGTFVYLYKGSIADKAVLLSSVNPNELDPVVDNGNGSTTILQAATSIVIDGTSYTNDSGTTRDDMHTLLSTDSVHKILLNGVDHSAVDTGYIGIAKHLNSRVANGVCILVAILDGDDPNYSDGLAAADALQDELIAGLGL